MNLVDQWLAINAKYFPTEQVQYIRQRLEALPEQQLSLLYSISFQDPTMMLVISLFGGSLGIDRFMFFFRLYLLVLMAIYGVYLLHLPTPLNLILKPFGLKGWSAGLTRASVRLLHLDWQGAWDYNPLIYPLVVYILTYFFLFPIFSDKKIIEK